MSRQSTRVIARAIASLAIAVGGLDAAVSQDVPEAFEVCISCHAYLPNEPPLEAPSLWGVFGRRIASIEGFDYSAGLRGVAGYWDRPTLDRFLAAPQEFAPGIRMTFGGVRNAADRAVVLDFLETLAPRAGADESESKQDEHADH
jgi:cytochrome c2